MRWRDDKAAEGVRDDAIAGGRSRLIGRKAPVREPAGGFVR
jgi:hypothetical protein